MTVAFETAEKWNMKISAKAIFVQFAHPTSPQTKILRWKDAV